MNKNQRIGIKVLLVVFLFAGSQLAYSLEPQVNVTLVGPTTETVVSGFRGTAFVLGEASSTTHAVYGITNWEASDEPCKTTIHTENIMNSSQNSVFTKELCGTRSPGDQINISLEDNGPAGTRAFISAVRVCLNSGRDKVKGLDIRAMKITDSGALAAPGRVFPCGEASSPNYSETIFCDNPPAISRPNCDQSGGWKQWAECPAGSIATAVVLHYGAGNEPRSLTGIALKCRQLQID